MKTKDIQHLHIETQAVRADTSPEPHTGALVTPIFQSSTFLRKSATHPYEYGRTTHPTREALEKNLSILEEADYGFAFASGMAAIDAVLRILKPGDEIIVAEGLYGGTYRLLEHIYKKLGINIHYTPLHATDTLEQLLTPATRLVWLESPSNPLLTVIDIEQVAQIAHKYAALVVVDGTFTTPYLQKPLRLGADIVVHSATKYLGGHSDVILGALCTSNKEIAEQIYFIQCSAGAVPGPMDCFLTRRGIKTLHLRMEAHNRNALVVAKFLEKHAAVAEVFYPGLSSHAGHEVAKKQMKGGGGLVSFNLKTRDSKQIEKVLQRFQLFTWAESLGGVISLVCQPSTMTHASMPEAEREKRGITDSLLRLSVGVEQIDDLCDDLSTALKNL